MVQRIVKRTPSNVGNPIDDIRGIMSLLAPDPDDPLEYLGPVGLPVFIVKRLNRLRQIAGDPKAADEVRDIANDIVQSADADQLRLVQRELDEIETMGSNKIARDSDPNMPITAQYAEGSNIVMNVGRAKRIVNDTLKDQGPSMEEKSDILAKMKKKLDDPDEMKAGGMVMNYGDYGRTYKCPPNTISFIIDLCRSV